MKKIMKTIRKSIVGVILAVLLVVLAMPMAVFLSFCSKERRDKFTSGVHDCVMEVMRYLNDG